MKKYLFIAALSIMVSCSSPNETRTAMAELTSEMDAMLEGETNDNPYLEKLDSMPSGGERIRINPIGPSLAKAFNDSNYLHLNAAKQIGIKPIYSLSDAWNEGERLVKLKTCRYYYLDNLTHSLPYLVPEANDLLVDIGKQFIDSLQARGGGDYRIKVTSVTRTPASVRSLKRRNQNASEESAHQYGTTFDISYSKFICDSDNKPRTQEDLKNLLAEIIMKEKKAGRCYVKYERKQGCFHITVRPYDN